MCNLGKREDIMSDEREILIATLTRADVIMIRDALDILDPIGDSAKRRKEELLNLFSIRRLRGELFLRGRDARKESHE